MVDADSLYQKILDDPDDDAFRLQYASAIEASDPDHAALIRTQIDLWNHYSPELKMQEQRLLARCARRLVDPIAELVSYATLRRGFVYSARMAAIDFLDHGETLFARAPLTRLRLTRVDAVATRLFASPLLVKLRGLDLSRNHLDDEHVRVLAASRHLRTLVNLDLSHNHISRRGVGHLAQSETLTSLTWVGLADNVAPSPAAEGDGWVSGGEGLAKELIQRFGDRPWLHDPEPPRYW